MTTLFRYGFQQEAWRPTLGQASAADIIAQGLTTGASSYQAYTEEEKAKAAAEAAKANAQAAASNAQAAAINAAGRSSTILGIPSTYFMLGAFGLAALAVVLATNKK